MRMAPRSLLALMVVCLGTIAAPLDSAVNIAFPIIASEFGRPVSDIRWVVVSYVITYSSLLLVFGKLGDLIGYRIVFQAGLAVAAVGLSACAFAPVFEMLLVGRVLQGVGVALILSCAPALATTLFPETERTRILGIYAGMMALGHALGPLVSGWLVDLLGWGVAWWGRVPLVLSALALSWLIPARPGSGKAAGLDPLGSVQLVLALVSISVGLTVWSDRSGPWLPLVLVATGAVLLALFIPRQSLRAVPIIRPALFRDPWFSSINAMSVIASFATFSVMLIGPFYFIRIAGLETGVGGLMLAIGAFGSVAGSAVAARMTSAIGGRHTMTLGLALIAGGLGGIALWSATETVVGMALVLIVQGVGHGLFQVAYTDLVTATLPVEDRGVAGSLTILTRTMGITLGAVGHAALHRHFEAEAVARGLDATQAFMAGFAAVFWVAAGVIVLGGIVALGLRARARGRL
jgi:MFS family permease